MCKRSLVCSHLLDTWPIKLKRHFRVRGSLPRSAQVYSSGQRFQQIRTLHSKVSSLCAPDLRTVHSCLWALIPGAWAAEAGGVPKGLLIALEIRTSAAGQCFLGHPWTFSLFFFQTDNCVCTDTGSVCDNFHLRG
uniref:Uncharacterized protein n=1 Tax=Myotis myotis TaxID=51298 RepID=A0A7J7U5P3_MYOMY|nr:hypothetical protein mMyoMyo1_008884 [Myotis myotis]